MYLRRLMLLCSLLTFATTAFAAKDVYLGVGGSVGVFRTDARIFNPSTTKDIQIQAYYLPVGNGDNSGAQPKTITVPKRQMVVYDDVVASLLGASNLGAIRLTSDDEFVATQRIYAQGANGTLGQFVPGLNKTEAKKNGVLIGLKSNGAFRTNIGGVNPNNTAATVTWRLYDKHNALIATGNPITMPAYAAIAPTNMAANFFFTVPSGADLSDAWVSYSSTEPVFFYASLVDNGTTDPLYITAAEDMGATITTPNPPTPQGKVVEVTLRNFSITFNPPLNAQALRQGETVIFRVRNEAPDVEHGFQLHAPNGEVLVQPRFYAPGAAAIDNTFVVGQKGSYTFFCTNTSCGVGHASMFGSFSVGETDYDPGTGYQE